MTQPDRQQLLARLIDERNDEHGKGGAASVAREFGVSDAMVSGIRRGSYKGDTGRFLERVAERYGQEVVSCPACGGDISFRRCAENRKRPLVATSPLSVELWRACKMCDQNGGNRK